MGYAILRTQKLKHAQAVRRSMAHALRAQDTPNADPCRTPDNSASVASVDEALARFNERLATQAKVRSNAVLAVEYLLTGSPEDMNTKNREEQDAYFADALKWLEAKHGKENVVAWGVHRDETTPHLYAVVVPIDDKGKLNCRHFLGGAKALNEMQTDFAERVGRQHGLQRGLEGSRAHHVTIQQYYARANAATAAKTPAIDIPDAKFMEGKEAYGERVARAVVEQLTPELVSLRAKAQQGDLAAKRSKDAEATAKQAQAEAEQQRGRLSKLYKVAAIAELFTPEEIRMAQERRRAQDAERAKQSELAAERARRIEGLPKLLQRAGAALTLGEKAREALQRVGGDPSKVDWLPVEAETIHEAMVANGQAPESVIQAINQHSPGRADPASHKQIRDAVSNNADRYLAQYEARQSQITKGMDRS
jgi:hypothetical protein